MKKISILILSVVMGLSLCACGEKSVPTTNEVSTETTTETAEEEITGNEIGDTVSTDAAEVVLLNVSYESTYKGATPKDGYSFIVTDFSLKNIGKTDFGLFPTKGKGKSAYPNAIVSVDYNDGYTFFCDNVEGSDGKTYNSSYFLSPSNAKLTDLKPLSDGVTYQVAICVPNEVVDNTDASLLVKINLVNSDGEKVIAVYSVR